MPSLNQINVNGTTYDIKDSSAMALVTSPTNGDILTVNSSGQATDSGTKISDINTYKSGDTLTLGGVHCAGTLTGTRNLVRFFIPLSKPINATTVSISKLRISARGVSGTIIDNVDVADTVGYSITAKTIFANGIYIQVTLSTASTFTNNTVLETQIDDGVFTFS